MFIFHVFSPHISPCALCNVHAGMSTPSLDCGPAVDTVAPVTRHHTPAPPSLEGHGSPSTPRNSPLTMSKICQIHDYRVIKRSCEPFSAILQEFQIMRREFCAFCMEPLQPTQGSWLVPLEPPKSPKRGPF